MDGIQPGVLTFVDGQQIEYHPDPDGKAMVTPTNIVGGVISKVNEAKLIIKNIESDEMLSPKAKAAKIEEVGDSLIEHVVRANQSLDASAQGLADGEARWFAPPPLDKSDSVGFLSDEAKRAWVAKRSAGEKTRLAAEMNEGKHLDMALAILRSPVPTGWEGDMAREVWATKCRAEDPRRAEQFEIGRRSLAWGSRAMAHVSGVATRTAKADQQRIKRIVGKVTGKT